MNAARLHKWATLGWAAMAPPTLLWWRESILWVAFMSLYANVASHWAAYEAASLEGNKDGESYRGEDGLQSVPLGAQDERRQPALRRGLLALWADQLGIAGRGLRQGSATASLRDYAGRLRSARLSRWLIELVRAGNGERDSSVQSLLERAGTGRLRPGAASPEEDCAGHKPGNRGGTGLPWTWVARTRHLFEESAEGSRGVGSRGADAARLGCMLMAVPAHLICPPRETLEDVERAMGHDPARGRARAGANSSCTYNPTSDDDPAQDCNLPARWHFRCRSEDGDHIAHGLLSCDSHHNRAMIMYGPSMMGVHEVGSACGLEGSWWYEQPDECGSLCVSEERGIELGVLRYVDAEP